MAGTGDVTAASISLSGAWSGKTGPSGSWNEGMTEDETAGWHHRLDGHEFE